MKVRKLSYRKDGQLVTRTKFYAIFADHAGTVRRVPLFPDRKASEEAARKIGKLVDLRAAHDTIPDELNRWIECTSPFIREKLAEYDIIGTTKLAASKRLTEHVAEWRTALIAKGTTPKHADLVTTRAQTVFTKCGFVFWTDIAANAVLNKLASLRQGSDENHGISAQTFNFYLQAVKQFCRWMVDEKRASQSPLTHLKGLNVKTDRRHDRRALSADELRRLLDATTAGPVRVGVDGTERTMLYRLAVETGLRAGELRSLTRASFKLDGEEPTVTVAAAYSKNRREAVLPLLPTTATELKTHLSNKHPTALAFKVPESYDTADMIRADLAAARETWLNEAKTEEERSERESSSFLKYRDHAGRVADFHALRHTFISNLAAGGVHPKTAQQLARHSTITLTMDRYSHLYRGQLADALNVLPDLSQPATQVALATGTDAVCPVHQGTNSAANPVNTATATAAISTVSEQSESHVSPHVSPAGSFPLNSVESDGINFASSQASETPENMCVLTNSPLKTEQPPKGLGPLTCGLQNRSIHHVNIANAQSYDTDDSHVLPLVSAGPENDPELAELTRRWATLPPSVRAVIMGVLRSPAVSKANGKRKGIHMQGQGHGAACGSRSPAAVAPSTPEGMRGRLHGDGFAANVL